MRGKNRTVPAALGLAMAMSVLAACDNGPSAVATQPSGGVQSAGTQMASDGPDPVASPAREDHRRDPAPLLDGKPMWASSRRASPQDSARRSFERNGEDFGAADMEDFVRKAHAFVGHPPKGVETLKRANGDTLYYDPRGNVFAVADKTGAPRTMFKPDEGRAYWDEQKARETARADRRARRSSDEDREG